MSQSSMMGADPSCQGSKIASDKSGLFMGEPQGNFVVFRMTRPGVILGERLLGDYCCLECMCGGGFQIPSLMLCKLLANDLNGMYRAISRLEI